MRNSEVIHVSYVRIEKDLRDPFTQESSRNEIYLMSNGMSMRPI